MQNRQRTGDSPVGFQSEGGKGNEMSERKSNERPAGSGYDPRHAPAWERASRLGRYTACPANYGVRCPVERKEKKTHIDDQGLWCNAMDSLLSRRELIVLSSLLLSLGLATSDALQSCQ